MYINNIKDLIAVFDSIDYKQKNFTSYHSSTT